MNRPVSSWCVFKILSDHPEPMELRESQQKTLGLD